jgi:nucleoside-diphosphate-sugar epimerase
MFDFAGRRVLVTGGSGFIGGRLVEHLVAYGVKVRALVHRPDRSSRIARFPIEMMHGDVIKPADVAQAVAGCHVVFHCAYGNGATPEVQRLVNVEGTRNVLEASASAGVRRLVYTSTMLVYGVTPERDLTETSVRRHSGDVYADSKADSEKLTLDYARKRNLPVVVLQPTTVYGPYGVPWTINVLKVLRTRRQILVNGGEGICNPVYVDDVVNALLLAASKENVAGETFLVSGEEFIAWREFFARFERMFGTPRTLSMSTDEAKAHYARTRRAKGILRETLSILREKPEVRWRILEARELAMLIRLVGAGIPERARHALMGRSVATNGSTGAPAVAERDKPAQPLTPFMIDFYASKTRVRIDKAKRMLGYEPAFDFKLGMDLTEQWARWANLLPAPAESS